MSKKTLQLYKYAWVYMKDLANTETIEIMLKYVLIRLCFLLENLRGH